MAGYSVKNWVDEANHAGPPAVPPGTPLSAVAMEDAEDRLSTYTTMLAGTAAGIHNVMDYAGTAMVNNGVVDATTVIQTAINTAGSAGGGIVYFPPGTYKTTSMINISADNIALKGVAGTTSTVYSPSNISQFQLNDIDDFGCFDLAFDQAEAGAAGVTTFSMSAATKQRIRFERCTFKNLRGEAINMREVARGWVRDCFFNRVQYAAVAVINGSDIWIEDNQMDYCNMGQDAGECTIQLYAASPVDRCHIDRNSTFAGTFVGQGIAADGGNRVWIRDNHVYGAGTATAGAAEGISIGAEHVYCSGNHVTQNKAAGIMFGQYNATVGNIHIHDNFCNYNGSGIELTFQNTDHTGMRHVYVHDNLLQSNTVYGLHTYVMGGSTYDSEGGYFHVLIHHNDGSGNGTGGASVLTATGEHMPAGGSVLPEVYSNRFDDSTRGAADAG